MHDTARLIPFSTELAHGQRRLARAGFAVFLLIGAVQALYGPALPAIRASFGLSAAIAGWTVAAHYCGSVVGVLLSLVLEGRLHARRRLTVGTMLVGAGAGAFVLIPTWPWALTGVFCIGLGYGVLVVVVNALFASSFGDRSTSLLVLVNAAFGLGAVLGPLLYGLLSSGNFRPAFLVIGALGALTLPLVRAVPEMASPRRPASVPAGRGVPPALLGFVALFMLYTALESDTSGWMATHLIFHGYSQRAAAGLTAAFWSALTVGRLLAVPLGLRLSPLQMIAGALTGVIVLAVTANVGAITPATYVLIGLVLAPIFPMGFAWMELTLPGARGRAALALLGALAGGLIFPLAVGRVIGASTPDALPPALAVIALGCLMVTLSVPRLSRSIPTYEMQEGEPPSAAVR